MYYIHILSDKDITVRVMDDGPSMRSSAARSAEACKSARTVAEKLHRQLKAATARAKANDVEAERLEGNLQDQRLRLEVAEREWAARREHLLTEVCY